MTIIYISNTLAYTTPVFVWDEKDQCGDDFFLNEKQSHFFAICVSLTMKNCLCDNFYSHFQWNKYCIRTYQTLWMPPKLLTNWVFIRYVIEIGIFKQLAPLVEMVSMKDWTGSLISWKMPIASNECLAFRCMNFPQLLFYSINNFSSFSPQYKKKLRKMMKNASFCKIIYEMILRKLTNFKIS